MKVGYYSTTRSGYETYWDVIGRSWRPNRAEGVKKGASQCWVGEKGPFDGTSVLFVGICNLRNQSYSTDLEKRGEESDRNLPVTSVWSNLDRLENF